MMSCDDMCGVNVLNQTRCNVAFPDRMNVQALMAREIASRNFAPTRNEEYVVLYNTISCSKINYPLGGWGDKGLKGLLDM